MIPRLAKGSFQLDAAPSYGCSHHPALGLALLQTIHLWSGVCSYIFPSAETPWLFVKYWIFLAGSLDKESGKFMNKHKRCDEFHALFTDTTLAQCSGSSSQLRLDSLALDLA